ncbi:hypothetical protein HW450_04450 [Corynebacterium hindlerae]|uniref:Ribbon-helix-helix protein CopG domain-containing protein n=1 Tax=Corynebacterium hindlerae TaxID=699041 RepID=A0A7G5FH84_9CORY|nr:hypothetical protein [Corynebacterium hindlerae]QMV85975.1 hypothetical protein HW450_04450 [Corynebacterium hindlerae]
MALNLRLTPELDEQLGKMSELENKSKQQMLVSLIEERWQTMQARNVASTMLDRIYSERADLMERLRNA